ncbi:uncharacterized protein K02A2.6-like [Tachysurus ichikawai]
MLSHPIPDAPIAITTDASDYAVGAVHKQLVDGVWQLAFSVASSAQMSTSTALLTESCWRYSRQQQRHLAFISEFTTDIKHIDGKSNVVADCLSRATVQAVHWGIDFVQLATDQQSDTEVQAYRSAISSLKIADVRFAEAGVTLMCDVSRGHARPIIPVQWRRVVFDNIHSLSHPGQKASQKLVSSKFVWHGLKKDVRNWVSACVTCQRAKVQRHTKAPLDTFEANGLCERFHRSLKTALRASLTDDRWIERLPWVLLGLRTAPKEDLQTSSAELVYGQTLRVPGDFIPDCTKRWSLPSECSALLDRINAFKPVPTSRHGLTVAWMPKDLSAAEFVFIRHDAH